MNKECDGIKEQLDLTIERLNRIRKERALETDPSRKFSYDRQIEELEAETDTLKQRLESCYDIQQLSDLGLIATAVKNLHIDTEIGEIHLVNCNRHTSVNYFWHVFDRYAQAHRHFQYYYILACPSQQPNSFSERMVFELVIEELEEEFDAIHYVRQSSDSRRVKKEALPTGRNLKNSQKAFKKYFSSRFGLDQKNVSFETYLRTGLPKLNYKYVATVFEINAREWNPSVTPQYLRWLIDTFESAHDAVPTFIFFFVINMRDLHRILPLDIDTEEQLSDAERRQAITRQMQQALKRKDLKIFNSLKAIVDTHPELSTLITPLLPVHVEDLEDWIRNLGEDSQAKIEAVVHLILSGLEKSQKELYRKSKRIDMTDIEIFQEMVYNWVNE